MAADREAIERADAMCELHDAVIDAVIAAVRERADVDRAGSGSVYVGLDDDDERCVRISDHVHGVDRCDRQGRVMFQILVGDNSPNGLEAAHITDCDEISAVVDRAVEWLTA